ncbi:hypothetical protein HZI73_13560 [Vallitalea pronyensis]|uniref:Uncharacterized protein n=1 Tax=Vallitalea pronyensis TaxID=1348613 RepID=A0A8J8SHB1_9FIRM|nr:hypothetical protein [Vallitalea pronyensis]QUI23249.1 hypothetical protein HZI73_13560 [Vallitalea pronyensis]
MVRNFHIIIMLVAGIIVSILGLINGYDLKKLSITMMIVLLIFFIIGSIIQGILNKIYVQVETNKKARQLSEMDEEILRIKELEEAEDVDKEDQKIDDETTL